MQELNDKVDGGAGSQGSLPAAEWNQLPTEVQNVITQLGQTLSAGDLNQLGKGIAGYVANGTFYTDSGAADAYVLSGIGTKQTPPSYEDGMEIRFLAANANTGASTVNVASLGVKDIKTSIGADPAAGAISGRVSCVYDSANDWFELIADISGSTPTVQEFTSDGVWSKPLGCRYIVLEAVGGGGGGGSSNVGSAGGGGGGSGAASGRSTINVAGIASLTLTIGLGGTGGSTGNGNSGTDTTIVGTGVNLTAPGGGLGASNGASSPAATAVDFDVNFVGQAGDLGGASTFERSGKGGNTPYGYGGNGKFAPSSGNDGDGFGSGGSGGLSNSAANQDGGDGADGKVIITEFY